MRRTIVIGPVLSFIALVYLLGGSATYGQDRISVPKSFGQDSLSTEPVDIHIGAGHWRIPRNYFHVVTINPDSGRAFFQLLLHFPSFSGVTRKNYDCLKYPRCDSKILVHRIGNAKLTPYDKMAAAVDKNEKKEIHGLVNIAPPVNGLSPSAEYYFHRGTSSEDAVAIQCLPASFSRNYCRGYMAVTADLTIQYQFERKRLADWRGIHKGIIKLFDGFLVRGGS